MNHYKEVKNFNLNISNWNMVEEFGMPEDGDFCFVVYKTKTNIEFYSWSIGGYNQENKEFYCNLGLGGMIIEAEHVVAWKLMDDVDVLSTINYIFDELIQ